MVQNIKGKKGKFLRTVLISLNWSHPKIPGMIVKGDKVSKRNNVAEYFLKRKKSICKVFTPKPKTSISGFQGLVVELVN